jgi:hypothetical protein
MPEIAGGLRNAFATNDKSIASIFRGVMVAFLSRSG